MSVSEFSSASAGEEKLIVVTLVSGLHCGSGGCSTSLYKKQTDGQCHAIHFPHLHPYVPVGFDNMKNRFYLQGSSGCGVWQLSNKLKHIENIDKCPIYLKAEL